MLWKTCWNDVLRFQFQWWSAYYWFISDQSPFQIQSKNKRSYGDRFKAQENFTKRRNSLLDALAPLANLHCILWISQSQVAPLVGCGDLVTGQMKICHWTTLDHQFPQDLQGTVRCASSTSTRAIEPPRAHCICHHFSILHFVSEEERVAIGFSQGHIFFWKRLWFSALCLRMCADVCFCARLRVGSFNAHANSAP